MKRELFKFILICVAFGCLMTVGAGFEGGMDLLSVLGSLTVQISFLFLSARLLLPREEMAEEPVSSPTARSATPVQRRKPRVRVVQGGKASSGIVA